MYVSTILEQKGRAVVTVRQDATIMEVARKLADKRIGAVVVLGAERNVVGIASERDIVGILGLDGFEALSRPVEEIMTHDVMTCRESDTIDWLAGMMTEHRIRHLPVVENGRLIGIVSIGDVVKHHIAEVQMEAMAMRDYITAG